MTRSISKRKDAAIEAMGLMASEGVWMMHEPALVNLGIQMVKMAEEGKAPEVEARVPMFVLDAKEDGKRTAVISVTGVIRPREDTLSRRMGGTALTTLLAELSTAMADSTVSDVLFVFDTPGGSAQGLKDASNIIAGFRGVKPMVAQVEGLCASAGYYLASNMDRIVAKRDALVGSIGTKMLDVSVVRAWAEFGVDIESVHFGQHKVAGDPMAPMSEDRKAVIQELVDDFGRDFVEHVAQARGLSVEDVREKYGDGKVFKATTAVDRGLIDSVIEYSVPAKPVQNQNKNEGVSVSSAPSVSTDTVGAGVSVMESEMLTAKIRSAMFAADLINNLEASDAECNSALAAFYKVKGKEKPQDEQTALADLRSFMGGGSAAPNVQEAHQREQAEAAGSGMSLEQYKARREELSSIADLVNSGRPEALITSEMVAEALDSDKSIKAIQADWKEKNTAQLPETSLQSVQVLSNGADRFAVDAVEAIVSQAPVGGAPDNSRQNKLLGKSIMSLARMSLRSVGASFDEDTPAQEIAENALCMDSPSQMSFGVSSASGLVNSPASFPNIMAQAVRVIMDRAADQAPTTFESWAHQLPAADDFDPTSIGGHGVIDRLDDYVDGDEVKQKQMNEESKGWIEVKPKANDIFFTWSMMVSAIKFNRFMEQIAELGMAGKKTLNRELIGLLGNNVELVDGVNLFSDATHSNLITSGAGAPSDSQLTAMAAKHSAQTVPGATDPCGVFPSIVLVPDALRITAHKAFQTLMYKAGGQAVANIESSQDYFKDRVQVLSDVMLDGFSTQAWYSMVDPANSGLRSFVYQYLNGYGPNGQPVRYNDPRRRAQVYGVNFAAGAAVTGWRGAVKNPGA